MCCVCDRVLDVRLAVHWQATAQHHKGFTFVAQNKNNQMGESLVIRKAV